MVATRITRKRKAKRAKSSVQSGENHLVHDSFTVIHHLLVRPGRSNRLHNSFNLLTWAGGNVGLVQTKLHHRNRKEKQINLYIHPGKRKENSSRKRAQELCLARERKSNSHDSCGWPDWYAGLHESTKKNGAESYKSEATMARYFSNHKNAVYPPSTDIP